MNSQISTVLRLSPFVQGAPETSESLDTVGRMVVAAVDETYKNPPRPVVSSRDVPALEGRSMLAIISYCYLKRILCSRDVERKLWKDAFLAKSRFNDIPSAQTIRRFRKLNRDAIQATLEKALRRIRRTLFGKLPETIPTNTAIPSFQDEPGGGTTILIRREALDRIENAMILDTTLSDD